MKLLCLLSGGIDSPVAAYLMKEKGYSLEFVHFNMMPFGHTHTFDKVKKLIKKIGNKKLHVIEHGKWIGKAYEKIPRKNIICLLCRRRMLKQA